MLPLLEAQNLTVRFEGVVALQDFSLIVNDGEILGIIGPNGSGKTTFFNTISRFVESERGNIYFNSRQITRTSPYLIAELGIARTFQNLELFPYMTVLQNVMVGTHTHVNLLDIFRNIISRGERKRQEFMALEILDFLGISGFESSRPAGLPFGIQKLVELARTLVAKPKLILLDEPAAGLNEQETIELGRIIKDIRDDMEMTVLVVEHDMSLVMSISDRVIVLSSGETLAEGTPDEMKANHDVIEAFLGPVHTENVAA